MRERARDLSKRLSSTISDISFPIVYRQFMGKTIVASQGTITDNYTDVYSRAYEKGMTIRELAAAQGVIERGDVIFRITEDKVSPRSEEDEIYKSIYRWGTISINKNATWVTGASVDWSDIKPGHRIRFRSQGTFHRISTILNVNSQLALNEVYTQATILAASVATYQVYESYQVLGFEKRMSQAEYFVQGRKT